MRRQGQETDSELAIKDEEKYGTNKTISTRKR